MLFFGYYAPALRGETSPRIMGTGKILIADFAVGGIVEFRISNLQKIGRIDSGAEIFKRTGNVHVAFEALRGHL